MENANETPHELRCITPGFSRGEMGVMFLLGGVRVPDMLMGLEEACVIPGSCPAQTVFGPRFHILGDRGRLYHGL